MKLDLYTRLYLWLVARRQRVLFVVTILCVVAGIVASRMDFDEDIHSALPQNDPMVNDFRYILKKFRQIDRVYIDVSTPSAADAVYEALASNPSFERIVYRVELSDQHKVTSFLTQRLPNLFTETDAKKLSDMIEPARVRDYLIAMRRKLAGPEGLVLKDVVAADPIGMSRLVAERLLPLQTGFGNAHLEDGRITSADGQHILIVADPKFPSSDIRSSRSLISQLLEIKTNVKKQFPDARIAITGGHRMSVDNATLIRRDAMLCTVVGILAMGILCLMAFRRRWLALMVFLPTFIGMIIAAAVMKGINMQLSAIAMGFAAIAIGITVDYAIHVIYHLDEAAGLDRPAIGRHMARLVLPISVGALTTIAAFVVMTISPLRAYQQLGIFGSIGVFVSAMFALTILPLLVPHEKQPSSSMSWISRYMERFFQWRKKQTKPLLAIASILTILAIIGLPRLQFEGDIERMNGITPDTRHDEKVIHHTWGETLGMTMVVTRGATFEDALERNDEIADKLASTSSVNAYYSLASIYPSLVAQKANIQRWQAFWTTERRLKLKQTLSEVEHELGFRVNAFDAFWETVEKTPDWITLETFHNTPLEQILSDRIALANADNAIATLVKLNDRRQTQQLRDQLPQASVLDRKEFAAHIAELTKEGLGQFALWTAIVVTAIVYFSLGSLAVTAVILLPLGLGLVWTLGTMAWMGIPVDMMNCVFVIFIIGIGEDYAVFLATSRLDEWRGRTTRLASSGAAILIAALTTLFGFGVLAFAKHPVLWSLGMTVLLGMTFSIFATLTLTLLGMDMLLRDYSISSKNLRKKISFLYRYQGKWVEHFVFWKMRNDPIYAQLNTVVPKRGFILDLGCGYGQATHWLSLTHSERQLLGADYDADKIRVAKQSARGQSQLQFEKKDILEWEFPACDAILLLDVLHYWQPDKQQLILKKAQQALRPEGRLIVREADRANAKPHRWVVRWEKWMTKNGHNRTVEGLHFLTIKELESALHTAGFTQIDVTPNGKRDSNALIIAQ